MTRAAPASYTCGDCGVAPGHVHRDGCDVERCVVCGQQRITCHMEIRGVRQCHATPKDEKRAGGRLPWTGGAWEHFAVRFEVGGRPSTAKGRSR
jgi:hypothetical protein